MSQQYACVKIATKRMITLSKYNQSKKCCSFLELMLDHRGLWQFDYCRSSVHSIGFVFLLLDVCTNCLCSGSFIYRISFISISYTWLELSPILCTCCTFCVPATATTFHTLQLVPIRHTHTAKTTTRTVCSTRRHSHTGRSLASGYLCCRKTTSSRVLGYSTLSVVAPTVCAVSEWLAWFPVPLLRCWDRSRDDIHPQFLVRRRINNMSDSDEDDHSYSSAIAVSINNPAAAATDNNAIGHPIISIPATLLPNELFALHQCIFADDIRRLSQLLRSHDVGVKDKHGKSYVIGGVLGMRNKISDQWWFIRTR